MAVLIPVSAAMALCHEGAARIRYWIATGLITGGMALAFGIFPRWVALPLVFTMLMAIFFVTGAKGFNIVNGGAEYNFVLIMALLAIFFQGPGKWCIRK